MCRDNQSPGAWIRTFLLGRDGSLGTVVECVVCEVDLHVKRRQHSYRVDSTSPITPLGPCHDLVVHESDSAT